MVIVDPKRRRMVDMPENDTSSSLGKETNLAVLNYGKSKKWKWRALVSRPAKINEYLELELPWFG